MKKSNAKPDVGPRPGDVISYRSYKWDERLALIIERDPPLIDTDIPIDDDYSVEAYLECHNSDWDDAEEGAQRGLTQHYPTPHLILQEGRQKILWLKGPDDWCTL